MNDLEAFVGDVANHPVDFEPGTQFLYGLNQAILGRLVEVLSGQPFEDYLRRSLFEPLQINDTSFSLDAPRKKRFQPLWIHNETLKGYTDLLDELSYHSNNRAHFGGEGLVSSLRDYTNFCQMLLQ